MSKNNRVTVVAEIPEEMLEQWRLFVVLHGGKVIAPVDKDEVEQYRKKVQYYEKVLFERAEQRQSYADKVVEELEGLKCAAQDDSVAEVISTAIWNKAISKAIWIAKGAWSND